MKEKIRKMNVAESVMEALDDFDESVMMSSSKQEKIKDVVPGPKFDHKISYYNYEYLEKKVGLFQRDHQCEYRHISDQLT